MIRAFIGIALPPAIRGAAQAALFRSAEMRFCSKETAL